jgi:hypothetical protein
MSHPELDIKTTLEAYFKSVKDPILRKKLLYNLVNHPLEAYPKADGITDINEAIQFGFHWSKTSEGFDYWVQYGTDYRTPIVLSTTPIKGDKHYTPKDKKRLLLLK